MNVIKDSVLGWMAGGWEWDAGDQHAAESLADAIIAAGYGREVEQLDTQRVVTVLFDDADQAQVWFNSVTSSWPEGARRADVGLPYVMWLLPDQIGRLFNPAYSIRRRRR